MDTTRYSKQILFSPIGEKGQKRIQSGSVVIVGCGALGTAVANNLARAGLGRIRIIDRDFVELDNLQRQLLFDEEDARRCLPKAVAAVKRLEKINSLIELEPVVSDVGPRNVEKLIQGFSIVLDATDNLETRYLLNDACIKRSIPWIYGGAVGSTGMAMPIVPGRTPCLRCFIRDIPPPGTLPTCDRAGVLNTVTALVAAMQSTAALKYLIGEQDFSWQMLSVDIWNGEFNHLRVKKRKDCPACANHRFDFLEGKTTSWTTVLCGRNIVQITPPEERPIPLEALSKSLAHAGKVSYNGFLIRFEPGQHELIIFPSGRVMVKGTADEHVARTLYAKYIGM